VVLEDGADRVGPERGDRAEHLGLSQRPLAGQIGDETPERPVVREEDGQLGVGVRGGVDEGWEQQDGFGDDVVVERVPVELVAIGEEDISQG
jgi:hypothetical protein